MTVVDAVDAAAEELAAAAVVGLLFDSPLLLRPIATAPIARTRTTAAAAPSGNSRVRGVRRSFSRAGRANGTTSAVPPAAGADADADAAARAASSRATTSAGIGIGGSAR